MTVKCLRSFAVALLVSALAFLLAGSARAAHEHDLADDLQTKTPIKHLVVIFGENISFDHYFATYPFALNPSPNPNDDRLFRKKDTPRVNNLLTSGLLHDNPNSTQPFRLDRTQAWTCDQDHSYIREQQGRSIISRWICSRRGHAARPTASGQLSASVATISTAVQNWSWGITMAIPSPPLELCSALRHERQFLRFHLRTVHAGRVKPDRRQHVPRHCNGKQQGSGKREHEWHFGRRGSTGSLIGDGRPAFDDCAPTGRTYIAMSGTGSGPGHDNIGDLLSARNVTWGWLEEHCSQQWHDSTGNLRHYVGGRAGLRDHRSAGFRLPSPSSITPRSEESQRTCTIFAPPA